MPVIPAPTTSTSTAMSSFNAENLGAGVLSVQYDPVVKEVISTQNASVTPESCVVGTVGAVGASGAMAQIFAECAHGLPAVADCDLLVV